MTPARRPAHAGDAWLLAAAGFLYFLALKLRAWRAFEVHGELADFETLLWNVAHGHGLATAHGGGSFWIQHASPILYVLAPLSWLAPTPVTLLVVQAVVAAAAVLPLHALAMRLVQHRGAAAAVAVAYLTSRIVHNGVTYDFHMEVFYPLAFGSAFLAFETRRWGWFACSIAVALAVKEDAAIATIGLGLWMMLRGERRAGLLTAGTAAAWLALVLGVVLPHARAAEQGGSYRFASYWSDYGATLPEIARHMLDPRRHATVLFTPLKLRKLFTLFSTFAFLPLVAGWPTLFLVAPSWFLLYSSSNALLYGALVYYGFLLVPFLFYASLLAMRRLGRFAAVAAMAVLVLHVANSRLFTEARPRAWQVPARMQTAARLLARIPAHVPVATQVDLVSHVPRRAWRTVLPSGIARAEWVLFDLDGNPWPSTTSRNAALAESLSADRSWQVTERANGFVLLRYTPTAPTRP